MRETPVIIFGAGATRDCGGPLTNEILPEAFKASPNLLQQQEAIALLRSFLDQCFPLSHERLESQDYPSLPLFLSLLDTAIDRKHPFGQAWPSESVNKVREAIEAAIFAVLDFRSPQQETDSYLGLLRLAFPGLLPEAAVISLNYDMILDAAMFDLCQERKFDSVPSYGCDIKTEGYQSKERWGSLLKIHGSVNWMYCSQCHHLEIGWSTKHGAPSRIGQLFFRTLDDQYTHKSLCPECRTRLRPILITPTHKKDYRNPHLARVWYEAERVLQRANRVIFVGYSLPDDDVEVIYLLKRGLSMPNPEPLAPQQITVIEKDEQHRPLHIHPVGQRYRALFGDNVDFRTEGFSVWLGACQQSNPALAPGFPSCRDTLHQGDQVVLERAHKSIMQPRPTDHIGLLRVPGPALNTVCMRFAPLSDRDRFVPSAWPQQTLTKSPTFDGWWEIDLDLLSPADGDYEYDFVINGTTVVADPYAEEITRFGGYRGVFTIAEGKRVRRPFRWDGETPSGVNLPSNNQIVIYEMPIKWMSSDPAEAAPLVELGTFDAVIFEHLDDLASMGVNCIELLPVEDSPQTLNWGYGTRFFFAPDYDVGKAVDAKFFIKTCHQRGIRVVLDVVMNMFSLQCPLAVLAPQWFYEPASSGRANWSQDLFRFNTPAYDDYFAAREFLCEMAEFWVSEYHVDGFRIDDFADINNWDFVQEFHDRATAKSQGLFPGKPFLVVAEDSNRRFVTTADNSFNPGGRKVVDAIWNFGYRDEVRRLVTNSINTVWGQPSRSARVQHLISKGGVWNDWNHAFDSGYVDMACSVDYITSHDVADAPRLMNIILGPMLRAANLGDGGLDNIRAAVDIADTSSNATLKAAVQAALRRVFGAFGILMTSVGIPMWLAGEEFGDVHDTDYIDVNTKQQDPVQWNRETFHANAELKANFAKLVKLRTVHPALQRNEVEFFYAHPQFDDNYSPRVFAYCRSAGLPLGSSGQVIVIANMGPQSFPNYDIPSWRWDVSALMEVGYVNTMPSYNPMNGTLSLSLNPYEARVFTS